MLMLPGMHKMTERGIGCLNSVVCCTTFWGKERGGGREERVRSRGSTVQLMQVRTPFSGHRIFFSYMTWS